jgi:hypothetical protein
MLEKIHGVSRSYTLVIIQLLEADLNQVIIISFTRSITKLSNNQSGIISDLQYGWYNQTCMNPVLNKLLTVKLIIQQKTAGIVLDNDANGCYDPIISGIAHAVLCRTGYSKSAVKMMGMLWEELEHHG